MSRNLLRGKQLDKIVSNTWNGNVHKSQFWLLIKEIGNFPCLLYLQCYLLCRHVYMIYRLFNKKLEKSFAIWSNVNIECVLLIPLVVNSSVSLQIFIFLFDWWNWRSSYRKYFFINNYSTFYNTILYFSRGYIRIFEFSISRAGGEV